MVVVQLIVGAAWASCADPVVAVDESVERVLRADLEGTQAALARAEAAFACGAPAEPRLLARMWIAEGAMLTFAGDAASAVDSFAAARRVDPAEWNEALGDDLRETWEAASPAAGQARLALSPARGEPWVVWVDGAPIAAVSLESSDVSPGLHLVQVGTAGTAQFARIVLVGAGGTQIVEHDLPAEPKAPRVSGGGSTTGGSAVFGHVALGTDLALGASLSDPANLEPREPGTKFMIPAEVGVGLADEARWVRLSVTAAPLVGGQLLYAVDGVAGSSRVATGVHVAGGLSRGDVDVGLSAGLVMPGRLPIRALASIPAGPLRLEGRIGLNVMTGSRSPEPSLGLALAFHPGR